MVKSTTTDTYAAVGDLIDYSYDVTNSGNVTLAEPVTIADDKTTATCALSGDGDLDVGETVICTAVDYVVTQADIDFGSVTNLATASADGTTSNQDSVTVTATQDPLLSITKVAAEENYDAVDDVINYTITATNIGNVTLEDVTVTDPNVTGLTCDPANGSELAPGDSMTCTATHTITQADLDAGHYANTACVDDSGAAAEICADEDVPAIQNPAIDIEKATNGEDADAAPGLSILVGQPITWTYVVTNTGNVTLFGIQVSDDQPGVIVTCTTTNLILELAVGSSETCTASGTAVAGQYENTGTAAGTDPQGDPAEDSDLSHYFGADPSFTVSKSCTNEPVPQEGPADFEVVIVNTGNVPLSITTDEVGNFSLPINNDEGDGEKTFVVTVDGPFSGQDTVDNTIYATGSYTDDEGLKWSISGSSFDSCTVGGRTSLLKLTQDQVDPEIGWEFNLYLGPNDGSMDSIFLSSPVASSSTFGDPDGLLEFIDTTGYPYNLNPGSTYTVCEMELPAGWATFWRVDTDNDGVVDSTVLPYNPNESDDPPEDLGNRCYDFTVGAGNTLAFEVWNNYPGGDPRTPGYWKNWNRVTGGGQAINADRNGGWAAGFWLLEDVLDPDVGGGILWDDILDDDGYFPEYVSPINSAAVAVDILDQREIGDPSVPGDGIKHSSDAAYTLAMHLLAAQLNFGAYAESCDEARDAVLAGEMLLDEYDFNATGNYLVSKDKKVRADYNLALNLANGLDLYNNGYLCVGPAVSFISPVGGTVFGTGDPTTVTVEVSVQDMNGIDRVDFYVDGAYLDSDLDGNDGWTASWNWSLEADGSLIIEAIAFTLDESGSADVTVFVDLVPDVPMYVDDITTATEPGKNGKWDAIVTPFINDGGASAVDGATVYGVWENGTFGSCTTDGTGTCDISITNKNVTSTSFTVTDVTHAAFVYDASLNEATEVTIPQP